MSKLETTIRKVTVFVDRARLVRSGKMDFEIGTHKVEISDLPTAIEPESVRVKAKGSAGAVIRGVDVKRAFFKDVPPGKIRELTDQLQQLEDNDLERADFAESMENQIKHLDGLAENTRIYSVALAKGKTTPETHTTLMDFITTKRSEAQKKIRENNIQRRELTKEIEKIKNEIAQLGRTPKKERFTAEVELEITRPGELEIQLIYIFRNAGWIPLYDIRLLPDQLEVNYIGQVHQNSGEDWNDVSITLSTARPATSTTVPELNPWYLNVFRPRPPMMAYAAEGAMAGAARAKSAMPPPPASPIPMAAECEPDDDLFLEEAEIQTAQVVQEGAFVTYELNGTYDITGNGSPHKTTIALFNLNPEADYATAPKIQELAYRRIFALNDGPYTLLPGKAQLFDGEDYIGNTFLKLISAGERLKLYFGSDDRIKIKRELVNHETEKKFMADIKRIRYAYQIKLENLTNATQSITVTDQIPIPKHEKIKVKLEESTPQPNQEDEMGRLKWKLSMTPNSKQTIRFDFHVEYPRDLDVIGLP